ncbi:hypothetical protein [Nonomuraea sp. LPB2021202275-12-8]|uniref:hypothetical protein n=1 Tax=Nonomuraea sp. LPB2021202275-12-8 TaxID=3120159 RepID=UPI00300CA478
MDTKPNSIAVTEHLLTANDGYDGATSLSAPTVLEIETGYKETVARDGTPGSTFWAFRDFRQKRFFSRRFTFDPAVVTVNAFSQVAASLTELGVVGSQVVPISGSAHMVLYNVTPSTNAIVVKGDIGWEAELMIRINFIIVN